MSQRRLRIEIIAGISVEHFSGATTHVFELASRLARGNEVHLWLPRQSPVSGSFDGGFEIRYYGRLQEAGAGLLWLAGAIRNEVELFCRLLRTALLRRPDAIYVRETFTFAPGVVARIRGVPMYIEVNGPILNRTAERFGPRLGRLVGWMVKRHASMARAVFPMTRQHELRMVEAYGLRPARVRYMPNGANLDRFSPMPAVEARRSLGLDVGASYLVWSGSIRPNQEIEVLLKAMVGLARRRPRSRLLLLAHQAEALRSQVDGLCLTENVVLRAVPYDKVADYVNASDVGVATWRRSERSNSGGVSPLKLFEYLACARPVVTARLPGLEFVELEALGLLYEPGDASSLADQMERLLELTEADRQNMGASGRAYVEQHHDWAKTAALVEAEIRRAAPE